VARYSLIIKKGDIKMKKVSWWVVGIFGLIVLLFLIGGGMMSGWGYGNYGYGGWGMMGGPGMMGWGYSPFGWMGMLFMWLIPVGFIVLTVLGIAWLARGSGNTTILSSQIPCHNCGKAVQADWKNCPYCGTTLK
jgi:hypothetical protein